MEQQNELFEDKEIVVNIPYNIPLKRIFNDEQFEIETYGRNGEKPFIIVRYKKEK